MIRDISASYRIFSIMNTILLIIISIVCFYPIWYTLCLSVSDKAATSAGWITFYPIGFSLTNYAEIINDKAFFNSFWISVKRVLIGTSISLSIIIMLAYPLSKTISEFRMRNAMMWLVIFCMLFNGGTVPWYMCLKSYGWIDSMWGLVFAGGLPVFNVILMMNFFKCLPVDVEEAAIVDGAGPWRILFAIIVLCSIPIIATITLFIGVGYWNEYFQGLVLSNKEFNYPLQTYIQQIVVNISTNANLTTDQMIRMSQLSNKGLNAAKVFITIIPMIVVYPWLSRYFISGIMLGAVKG